MSQWQMPPQYGPTTQLPVIGYPPVIELKQNGVGMASFILSIVLGIGMFALIVVAGVMETSRPGGIDEESAEAVVLGLALIGGMLLNVVGAVLGIVGLFLRDRKKLFAVLGLTFNGLILFGVIGLMIIGTLAS